MVKFPQGEKNMVLNEIYIENFKSFDKATFKLNKMNVILGMNASGKSNFTSILSFLRDFEQHGLENAIALQGGYKYLTNIKIGRDKPTILKFTTTPRTGELVSDVGNELIGIKPISLVYELKIDFHEVEEPKVTETIDQKVSIVKIVDQKDEEILANGSLFFEIIDGRSLKQKNDFTEELKKEYKIESLFLERAVSIYKSNANRQNQKLYALQNPILFTSSVLDFAEFFRELSIYYIDPKQSKKSVQMMGKSELEDDGSNLALVLNKILKNEDKSRKLKKIIKQLLPFIDNILVEKQSDNTLYFKINEVYKSIQKEGFPSVLLSDGTINITALVVALFFEDKVCLCFEEPERNIHPNLLSNLLSMMKDVSNNKQIILTTHNPEIVKHIELGDIKMIRRDNNGFSKVIDPTNHVMINEFLKNDIGMEEIFVDNMF